MDTDAPNQQTDEGASYSLDNFQPLKSGQLTRFLDRDDIREGQASAIDQALGIRAPDELVDNANNYVYQRTVEFPQPSMAGIGVVTAAGAPDLTRYFFSQQWTVAKTATGVYRVTHNIGDGKYNVQLAPVATTAFTSVIGAFTATYFEVRTFNAAGTATDCSFTFTVYIIP